VSAVTWLGVAALGGAAAIARLLLDGIVGALLAGRFPLGTLVVNVSGALLLGLVTGLAFSGATLVLVGTATLGSYTTFSTWMLETQRIGEDGSSLAAWLNVFVSLALGVAAVALGRTLGAHA
jgi:CrcB protein